MRIAFAVGIIAVSGCSVGQSSSSDLDRSELQGYWVLEAIEEDGVRSDVEVGVNTARPAWIHFNEVIEGTSGCNDFRNSTERWRFEDGRLWPGEVIFTAALCGADGDYESQMVTELAMQS